MERINNDRMEKMMIRDMKYYNPSVLTPEYKSAVSSVANGSKLFSN